MPNDRPEPGRTVSVGDGASGWLASGGVLEQNLNAGATILGSPDPEDYPVRDSVWGDGAREISSLIYAEDAENVAIRGRGTIDGQGQHWWRRAGWPKRLKIPAARRTPSEMAELARLAYGRPHLVKLVRCRFVTIEQLRMVNSGMWIVHPLLCEFVRIDGVTILNPVPSPNTDGINQKSCRNVQISNCRIDAGDDCVTLKSGMDEAGRRMGRPDENITISNCVMLRGHGGVTVGSEMSGGVRNVVVSNCVFQGTDVGIRVKSQRGRGGVVEGLAVSNVVMQDVASAFTITAFYSGGDKPEETYPLGEGTPRFRDFLFSNITVRGSKTAGQITGLRELPVENITFSNVRIEAGTGLKCTNATEIAFHDVTLDTDEGPALSLVNCSRIDAVRLASRRRKNTRSFKRTRLQGDNRIARIFLPFAAYAAFLHGYNGSHGASRNGTGFVAGGPAGHGAGGGGFPCGGTGFQAGAGFDDIP